MRLVISLALLSAIFSGCANIPLKEGGLEIGKNTTASVDYTGIARITNEF